MSDLDGMTTAWKINHNPFDISISYNINSSVWDGIGDHEYDDGSNTQSFNYFNPANTSPKTALTIADHDPINSSMASWSRLINELSTFCLSQSDILNARLALD